MAKNGGNGIHAGHVFMLIFSIFVLHVILAYLVAVCTNYLLIKYDFKEEDFFQINTLAHTFASIIDIMLVALVLKYFL